MSMKMLKISTGGQVSIPAEIRKRWGTRRLTIEDHGDSIVLRPIPDDPVAAARGALKGRIPASDELRRQARLDEQSAEDRKWASF
jgi:AbrB family looped-hinge helix DNA binding protein